MNHWTFNMPSDHAEVELEGRSRTAHRRSSHKEGEGLRIAMMFIHENRIRQAAGSGRRGALLHPPRRWPMPSRGVIFGEPLATMAGDQFPLAELHAECEMIRT